MANPPAQTWAADVVAAGERHYARLCGRCHGPATQSANVIPDLRRSAALTDAPLWRAIVVDGALQANGMVGWGHVIDADAAESIRAYVGEQARALRRAEPAAQP